MRILLFFSLLLFNAFAFGQDSITIAAGTNDLHRYTIFLKGEFHEHKVENERSFLLLAQYLYAHNNVRYLVFEYGPDFTYLANRYLKMQNDSLKPNRFWFTKAFWDTLACHNRSKSIADKIEIQGFDFNRSVFTAMAFGEMMKGKTPFSDLTVQSALEKIIAWKDIAWTWNGQKDFVEQMKALRLLIKSHSSALVTYFGDDWPSFFNIVNHDVESTPMVKRDKKTIDYVKEFLSKKGNGNVLFNLGVNHIFFDGAGIGSLLHKDKYYRGKVCSIYPYHLMPDAEKENYQQEQDENLPATFLGELQTAADYSLVNMLGREIYPKRYKKTQWVYVIPKVKQL